MATDLPRFTITLPDDVYTRVLQYKEEQKISTQSKAIQRLIIVGLDAVREQTAQPEPLKIEPKYKLLDDHGRRVVDYIIDEELGRLAETKEAQVIDFGTIRRYFYSPAAGKDGLAVDYYEDIPRTPDMPKGADYCLTIAGDSMEPYIHDGQMVFVKRDVQVLPFEVGVWYYQGGTYVKQYFKEADGGVWLLSANPERENTNVYVPAEVSDDLHFYGKVLGLKHLPRPEYGNL